MYHNEKWKDGWLWIQTAPDGKWEAGGFDETFKALAERVAKLERPAEAVESAVFDPEDFAYVAKRLRGVAKDNSPFRGEMFHSVCSNNLNIILAALDTMSKDMAP